MSNDADVDVDNDAAARFKLLEIDDGRAPAPPPPPPAPPVASSVVATVAIPWRERAERAELYLRESGAMYERANARAVRLRKALTVCLFLLIFVLLAAAITGGSAYRNWRQARDLDSQNADLHKQLNDSTKQNDLLRARVDGYEKRPPDHLDVAQGCDIPYAFWTSNPDGSCAVRLPNIPFLGLDMADSKALPAGFRWSALPPLGTWSTEVDANTSVDATCDRPYRVFVQGPQGEVDPKDLIAMEGVTFVNGPKLSKLWFMLEGGGQGWCAVWTHVKK